MISGWVKRKHSAATRGAPEDVLQTKITLGIDYGTAAIRAKTDRVRIFEGGAISPKVATIVTIENVSAVAFRLVLLTSRRQERTPKQTPTLFLDRRYELRPYAGDIGVWIRRNLASPQRAVYLRARSGA